MSTELSILGSIFIFIHSFFLYSQTCVLFKMKFPTPRVVYRPQNKRAGKGKGHHGGGPLLSCASSGLPDMPARVSCTFQEALTTSAIKKELTYMSLYFLFYSLVIFISNQGKII